jgi:hypothetical protein
MSPRLSPEAAEIERVAERRRIAAMLKRQAARYEERSRAKAGVDCQIDLAMASALKVEAERVLDGDHWGMP